MNKTTAKVLGVFTGHMTESFTLREVARMLKMHVSLAHRAIKPLIERNIVQQDKHKNLNMLNNKLLVSLIVTLLILFISGCADLSGDAKSALSFKDITEQTATLNANGILTQTTTFSFSDDKFKVEIKEGTIVSSNDKIDSITVEIVDSSPLSPNLIDQAVAMPYFPDFIQDLTFSEAVKLTYLLDNEDLEYDNIDWEMTRVMLLDENGNVLQYVPFKYGNFKTFEKIDVWITHSFFDSIAILEIEGMDEWDQAYLYSEYDETGGYFSQVNKNPVSICIPDTPKKKATVEGMIGQSVCAKECGADPLCDGKQPGDSCGMGNICSPNCGCVVKRTSKSCSDNIKNQGEENIDCGGPCAPCNNVCTTGTKYAPEDSGCTKAWPDGDSVGGLKIMFGNNICDWKCNILEICSPELDYIIEEASDCCAGKLSAKWASSYEDNSFTTGCEWAIEEAENHFNGDKTACRSLYLIRYMTGLNIDRKYNRYGGFIEGVNCDFDVGDKCDSNNPSLDGLECRNPPCGACTMDENGQTLCYDAEYGESGCFFGSWHSDTDMSQNYCWSGPHPAHTTINILEQGICIGNSLSLLTMLRKAGVPYEDVYQAGVPGHSTVFLKFHGDNKFHRIEPNKWDNIGYTYHDHPIPGYEPECSLTNLYNDVVHIGSPSGSEYAPYGCSDIESLESPPFICN